MKVTSDYDIPEVVTHCRRKSSLQTPRASAARGPQNEPARRRPGGMQPALTPAGSLQPAGSPQPAQRSSVLQILAQIRGVAAPPAAARQQPILRTQPPKLAGSPQPAQRSSWVLQIPARVRGAAPPAAARQRLIPRTQPPPTLASSLQPPQRGSVPRSPAQLRGVAVLHAAACQQLMLRGQRHALRHAPQQTAATVAGVLRSRRCSMPRSTSPMQRLPRTGGAAR